jgi:hypothetical protein
MSEALRMAAGFGIDEELFDRICRAICPDELIVKSKHISGRYPPNIRARALRVCRVIVEERLDSILNGV